jgi:ADP-heptose:LPS heptosyltransferase
LIGPLLILLPHNPGDVVMALMAAARVKAAYPRLPIDYIVGEECRALVENHPLLRKVHVLPRGRIKEAWARGDGAAVLSGLEAFLEELREARPAFALNLFQERWGGLLQGLLAAPRKAGLELADGAHFRVGSRYLEHLFAVPAARRDNGWHAVDVYIRAARELVESGTGARTVPWPRPGGARSLLPPLDPPEDWQGPEPGAYLAFHPGSAWPGKRWPERHWSTLAAACVRAGLPVVLTGSEEERESLSRIRAALPPEARDGVHDWSGRTTLAGAAWIHARARMTVTGDTVAMHLAAAAGTPTLSLFGPSNPVETGPYGTGHFILQTQAEHASDLEFEREHAGLSALDPAAVAAFILRGETPSRLPLWETAWDGALDCQVLRDARGAVHPHQRRAAPLMDFLDRRPAGLTAGGPVEKPALPPTDARSRVDACLLRCASEAERGGLGRESIAALEAADRALASATAGSLVWEAYRIALNGLPLRDIREHLALRRSRFDRALQEEAAAGYGGSGGSPGPGLASLPP